MRKKGLRKPNTEKGRHEREKEKETGLSAMIKLRRTHKNDKDAYKNNDQYLQKNKY